jgi:CheY-like chemotaxis protein
VIGAIPSLLITDDDLGFRETLRGVLESQGFRTLMAECGEQALDVVRREEVHLVLLDMHMPRLTGLETLRRVKQIKAILPCIILSANADDELREEARLAEAFSVLSKPVSRINLTNIVRTALWRTYKWQL